MCVQGLPVLKVTHADFSLRGSFCARVQNTEQGKSGFTAVSTRNTEFILVLLFINYCIIFHMNNRKSTYAPPRVMSEDCERPSMRKWVSFG